MARKQPKIFNFTLCFSRLLVHIFHLYIFASVLFSPVGFCYWCYYQRCRSFCSNQLSTLVVVVFFLCNLRFFCVFNFNFKLKIHRQITNCKYSKTMFECVFVLLQIDFRLKPILIACCCLL